MSKIKLILGHLYCFYFALSFAVTLLLIALPAVIFSKIYPEPKRLKIVHRAYRVWMETLYIITFIRKEVRGIENFDKNKSYVVVVNHNSFLDVLVTTPWIPVDTKTLAKKEFMKIPIFRTIYGAGSVIVDRSSKTSRHKSFQDMLDVLRLGQSLCLFPEGTRNKTKEPLQKFYDGAFVTALKAQVPIAPGILFNTKQILPQNPKFWAWPGTVHFHFLPPISTEGMSPDQLDELKTTTRKVMGDYILAHQNELA